MTKGTWTTPHSWVGPGPALNRSTTWCRPLTASGSSALVYGTYSTPTSDPTTRSNGYPAPSRGPTEPRCGTGSRTSRCTMTCSTMSSPPSGQRPAHPHGVLPRQAGRARSHRTTQQVPDHRHLGNRRRRPARARPRRRRLHEHGHRSVSSSPPTRRSHVRRDDEDSDGSARQGGALGGA